MKPYNGFSGAQREAAAKWIREGIAAGAFPPPSACFCCGQSSGVIHYHCENYSAPFGRHTIRYPLCWTCHMVWHCRNRNGRAVRAYIERVASGFRAEPVCGGFQELDRLMRGMFSGMRGTTVDDPPGDGPWRSMNAEAARITGSDFLYGQ